MTVLAFALIVVAVVAVVLFLRREVNRAVAKLTADIEGRQALMNEQQKTIYKQGKAGEKRAAQTERVANKAIAEARAVHRQIQVVLCDPMIQAAMRRAHEVEQEVSGHGR